MRILHVSAECFPAAKSGGLGDVVGALPKYQNFAGERADVIIPKYGTAWIKKQSTKMVHQGHISVGYERLWFSIDLVEDDQLGYRLYLANIPQYFEREGVYADSYGKFYGDEVNRYISFQLAVLEWMLAIDEKPDIVHCHDHHSGLIPFCMKYSVKYGVLRDIPSIFTIHNGNYQGAYSWHNAHLIPHFYENERGWLDWNNTINPMASAIRCAWAFTTVSPSYLEELKGGDSLISELIKSESARGFGLLNGIDTKVWDPSTDPFLEEKLEGNNISDFKKRNKKLICEQFGLNPKFPLITYIGRFAREKGAFILPDAIQQYFNNHYRANFMILGSGDEDLARRFNELKYTYEGLYNNYNGYHEGLAHLLYAGSDFLIMPSQLEPCGLNQMYSMRYGTIPIVRSTGGLKDSVVDIGDDGGGIRFNNLNTDDIMHALHRATFLYKEKDNVKRLRKRIMKYDYSWEKMTMEYIKLYNQYLNK